MAAEPHGGLDVDVLDNLAARTLEQAAPLRIGLAATDEQRRAVYRLRWMCVVESGWASPADLPSGLECDDYDAIAAHVVAYDGDVPVATCRLVFPAARRALPPEADFAIAVEPRGKVVSCDRLLVARGRRGRSLARAVLARAWVEIRARGLCVVAGTATPEAVQMFRGFGMHVDVLAGPRLLWGEQRYAIRASPAAGA